MNQQCKLIDNAEQQEADQLNYNTVLYNGKHIQQENTQFHEVVIQIRSKTNNILQKLNYDTQTSNNQSIKSINNHIINSLDVAASSIDAIQIQNSDFQQEIYQLQKGLQMLLHSKQLSQKRQQNIIRNIIVTCKQFNFLQLSQTSQLLINEKLNQVKTRLKRTEDKIESINTHKQGIQIVTDKKKIQLQKQKGIFELKRLCQMAETFIPTNTLPLQQIETIKNKIVNLERTVWKIQIKKSYNSNATIKQVTQQFQHTFSSVNKDFFLQLDTISDKLTQSLNSTSDLFNQVIRNVKQLKLQNKKYQDQMLQKNLDLEDKYRTTEELTEYNEVQLTVQQLQFKSEQDTQYIQQLRIQNDEQQNQLEVLHQQIIQQQQDFENTIKFTNNKQQIYQEYDNQQVDQSKLVLDLSNLVNVQSDENEHIKCLQNEVTSIVAQNSTVIQSLNAELDQIKSENTELHLQLNQLQTQKQELVDQVLKQSQQITEMHLNDQLLIQIEQLQNQINNLNQIKFENTQIKPEQCNDINQENIQANEQKSEQICENLSKLSISLTKSIAETNEHLESIKRKQIDLPYVNQDETKSLKVVSSLQTELLTVKNTYDKIYEHLQTQKPFQMFQEEIIFLQNQIKQYSEQNTEHRNTISNLQEQIIKLNFELRKSQQQEQQLNNDIQILKQQTENNKKLSSDNDQTSEQFNIQNQKINELQNLNAKLVKEIKSYQTKEEKLNQQIEFYQQQLELANSKNEKKGKEVQNQLVMKQNQVITDLQKQIEELRKEAVNDLESKEQLKFELQILKDKAQKDELYIEQKNNQLKQQEIIANQTNKTIQDLQIQIQQIQNLNDNKIYNLNEFIQGLQSKEQQLREQLEIKVLEVQQKEIEQTHLYAQINEQSFKQFNQNPTNCDTEQSQRVSELEQLLKEKNNELNSISVKFKEEQQNLIQSIKQYEILSIQQQKTAKNQQNQVSIDQLKTELIIKQQENQQLIHSLTKYESINIDLQKQISLIKQQKTSKL
ncbi:Conserved_hypothetical protein [Hexamita inflata]|uniref:Uncharacterized protein n=1 Tax=Hexamita inflata TaxID=28002 RepID=A0AA86PYE4_9EUKA|nr:Conserved hypothetical protein [Hexamita inflata]